MPGEDGLNPVACFLARDYKHAIIICCTARHSRKQTNIGLEMGGHDYVTKPVQPARIAGPHQGVLPPFTKPCRPGNARPRDGKLYHFQLLDN